jgi:hypothetical protein
MGDRIACLMAPIVKTPEELMLMREAGRILRGHCKPCVRLSGGIARRTDSIAPVIREHHATAAFLGYPPGGPYPSGHDRPRLITSWCTEFRADRFCRRATSST